MKRRELFAMLASELKALARKMSVAFSSRAKKAEIVDALLRASQMGTTGVADEMPRLKKGAGAVKAALRESRAAKKPIEASAHAPGRGWTLPPESKKPMMAKERVALQSARTTFQTIPQAKSIGFSPRAVSSSTRAGFAAATGTASPCPAKVKLDIEGLDATTKKDPGGLVVRHFDGNNAPRKKLILRKLDPASATLNVILTRSSLNIDVYTAQTGGTKLSFLGVDNKFANADLPKELWVEGVTGSAAMRDQRLTLALENLPNCKDEVFFTVVWVTITIKHTGSIANDNSAKPLYVSTVVPPSADLAYNLFVFGIPVWTGQDANAYNGRGSEFIGAVAPADFVPAQFQLGMNLAREVVDGLFWIGPNGNEKSFPAPVGDDTSPPQWRDDDPQSGGSSGKLYDLDQARINALTAGQDNLNWILRLRVNFKEWAVCNGVRCSVQMPWFSRQSYKFVGPFAEGSVTGANTNTVDDSTKNWTTNVWTPGIIWIMSGTGVDQFARITGNTATRITISVNWLVQPDSTSHYRAINKASWQIITQFQGDNQNGDGSTATSWNLQ